MEARAVTAGAALLPAIGLAAAAAALASAIAARRTGNAAWERIEAWSLAAAAASVAGAFLFLLSRFVVADLGYEYVFRYTSSDLPLRWRIAGTWAGREGSFLLWTAWLAVVAAGLAWSHRWRPDASLHRARAWARLALTGLLALFLVALLQHDVFARTPEFFLRGRPAGSGLNPTLKSGFILIHPPLTFLAYALMAVPAAAGAAHLARGDGAWSRVALLPSRWAWVATTAAMGLGGMWAYYTLGFGGYWAWDPVEVGNLLPWMALTLYLHAQAVHAKHGSFGLAGPLLATVPLLLTLLATVSTRSGLWVSVHAFTDPTGTFDPDPLGRMLAILDVEPTLGFYVGLALAVWLGALALWGLRLASQLGAGRRWSRGLALVLLPAAAFALVAPQSALSLAFEAARAVAPGRTGTALLGLMLAIPAVAAAPLVLAPDRESGAAPARRVRLDLRTLAAAAVLLLGLGLIVLLLFHFAAVNGWDPDFYETRLPWLATPAVLGLALLQGHGVHGRRRSVAVAAAILLAALVAAALATGASPAALGQHPGIAAYLLVMGAGLLMLSLQRVRTAGRHPRMAKRPLAAASLAWAAALLDLAFWVNAPTSLPLGWHPGLAARLTLSAASLATLAATHFLLAGCAPRRAGWIFAAAGLLGGFGVAAPLALAGWLLWRRAGWDRSGIDHAARARLRQAALFAVHLAVAVLLVGYTASTHLKQEDTLELAEGGTGHAGSTAVTFLGASLDSQGRGPLADDLAARLSVDGGAATGGMVAHLRWEAQASSHYPRPATLRSWHGDTYASLEAVTVGEGSACSPPGTVIEAYQASGRVCEGDSISAVRVAVSTLPGVGLVWTSFVLGVAAVAALAALAPRTTARPVPGQAAEPEPATPEREGGA